MTRHRCLPWMIAATLAAASPVPLGAQPAPGRARIQLDPERVIAEVHPHGIPPLRPQQLREVGEHGHVRDVVDVHDSQGVVDVVLVLVLVVELVVELVVGALVVAAVVGTSVVEAASSSPPEQAASSNSSALTMTAAMAVRVRIKVPSTVRCALRAAGAT